jgi:ribosomal protein S15P/S13E
MKGDARLLAIIADVDPHLELLPHDRLDSRFNLSPQFGHIDRLAAFLTEQKVRQCWRPS